MNLLLPVAAGGALLLLMSRGASASASQFAQAPPDGSAPPVPEPKPKARTWREMSEPLKKQLAAALSALRVHPNGQIVGTPTADSIRQGTQVAALLEAQGFYDAARDLRGFVDKASRLVPTPKAAVPIAQAAPPQLTAAQKAYFARVVSLERSPAVLKGVVRWLQGLPPSPERSSSIAMVEALIVQVQAAQSTAQTLEQIDEVIKSPGVPQIKQSVTPLAPVRVTPAAAAAAAVKTPTAAPQTVLPESPTVVPARPQPQPVPRALTPLETAARTMVKSLGATQARLGLAASKRSYDRGLVDKFQRLAGSRKPDGLPGPNTLLRAAGAGASDVPLVMFWPRTATAKTVLAYRQSLRGLADKFAARGRTADAERMRMAATRERGQGGISGRMPA